MDENSSLQEETKEKDSKKEKREEFAKNEIMVNYPNVSVEIFKHFEQIFNGD